MNTAKKYENYNKDNLAVSSHHGHTLKRRLGTFQRCPRLASFMVLPCLIRNSPTFTSRHGAHYRPTSNIGMRERSGLSSKALAREKDRNTSETTEEFPFFGGSFLCLRVLDHVAGSFFAILGPFPLLVEKRKNSQRPIVWVKLVHGYKGVFLVTWTIFGFRGRGSGRVSRTTVSSSGLTEERRKLATPPVNIRPLSLVRLK